jgi:uncharacterized membrane protein
MTITATSREGLRFLFHRFRERLWVRPLVVCLLSVAAAFAARLADGTGLTEVVPQLSVESIRRLLTIMASSMLVIATLSVSSMVAAYASAANSVTPRSFPLVVADDRSQNALSTFIGAFIFSVVALTGVENGVFARAGLFVLFLLTGAVFAAVIVTFVRWVDCIARLGRMGSTIAKVEAATTGSITRRCRAPTLGGVAASGEPAGRAVFADRAGYVQQVEVAALQAFAASADLRIRVTALPGTFAGPGRPLALVRDAGPGPFDPAPVRAAFRIGDERQFDDDPRFGLVVLGEIAGHALSPAVNDPGTAIAVLGSLTRVLEAWARRARDAAAAAPRFDRVAVPELSSADLFDDAFTAIARDGAGAVEVAVRLQKVLGSLASLDDAEVRDAAQRHARLALARATAAMSCDEDVDRVRAAALALG